MAMFMEMFMDMTGDLFGGMDGGNEYFFLNIMCCIVFILPSHLITLHTAQHTFLIPPSPPHLILLLYL